MCKLLNVKNVIRNFFVPAIEFLLNFIGVALLYSISMMNFFEPQSHGVHRETRRPFVNLCTTVFSVVQKNSEEQDFISKQLLKQNHN
jgi:hypothetical protein